MFLHEIEPGQKVFIDANIFVYHFSQGSRFNRSCTDFLYRVEASEVHGITSTAVVQETTHRLMMVEASAKAEVDVKNLPKYLKQHPDIVKQLTQHLLVPGKMTELNIDELVKSLFCHPELVSGSRNSLILLDAETSSA